MKDPLFIEKMLLEGQKAGEKVKHEFSDLSLEQLNWKSSPDKWSIGQCLDHLIIADSSYFPALKKIVSNAYKMTVWQKWSPFSGLFGSLLADKLQENVKMKMKAPKVFIPTYSHIDSGIINLFQKHLDLLLQYVAALKEMNIDKIRISSPAAKFVTYNLRHTVKILIPHLHRHINQAIRIKQKNDFPK